jgi:hypothetical protein
MASNIREDTSGYSEWSKFFCNHRARTIFRHLFTESTSANLPMLDDERQIRKLGNRAAHVTLSIDRLRLRSRRAFFSRVASCIIAFLRPITRIERQLFLSRTIFSPQLHLEPVLTFHNDAHKFLLLASDKPTLRHPRATTVLAIV